MIEKLKYVFASFLCCIVTVSCSDDEATNESELASGPIDVILDTDLGNSADDMLAFQALFYLQQQQKCNVLGIMSNMQLDKARLLIDGFLHYYKADDTPLGLLQGEETVFEMLPYYHLVDSLKADGSPFFSYTGIPLSERLPAWQLYRKLLANAEDHSIVIMCIGKYTNLGQLLDSAPDEYSPLSGYELVRRKVKRLEAMGGCFVNVPVHFPSEEGKVEFVTVEYNVGGDIPLAKKVLENWPTELCILPLEEGLKYPSKHDEVLADYAWQPDSPMYMVYSRYDEWSIGDVGQYWWDAELVMHAMLGDSYFNCTRKGILSIDDNGKTTFTQSDNGMAHVISTHAEHNQHVYDWLRGLSQFKP